MYLYIYLLFFLCMGPSFGYPSGYSMKYSMEHPLDIPLENTMGYLMERRWHGDGTVVERWWNGVVVNGTVVERWMLKRHHFFSNWRSHQLSRKKGHNTSTTTSLPSAGVRAPALRAAHVVGISVVGIFLTLVPNQLSRQIVYCFCSQTKQKS